MKDRRNYDRFAIDIPAVIFDPANGDETECMIRDISEAGISFFIPKKCLYALNIAIGKKIRFQIIDVFKIGNLLETHLLNENAIITHIIKEEDDVIIGCHVISHKYAEYVNKRYAYMQIMT